MPVTIKKPKIKVKAKPKLGWGDYIDEDDKSKGKNYPLHEGQLAVYNSETRFTAAIAGTGGGKTVVGPLWMAKQIERVRNASERAKPFLGMVVAPTYKVLQRATVPTLIDTYKGTVLEGIYKEARNLYELPDGGKIWCQGADNAGGLEGGQFDAVWLDEGGQVKYSVWVALQGRTGAKQAPILITTTPYGKNWLFHEVYKKYLAGDKNYYVKKWSSTLNPIYPEEEYERAKGAMTKEKGAMRYDGEFMALEGLVYPEIYRTFVQLDEIELTSLLSQHGKFYGGIDYGWNDPFCGLAGFLDSNDVLWLWYERYKSKTAIETHATALPKFQNRTITWFCEHNPELTLKLKKGGHRVKTATKNIVAGIDAVNARIYTDRIKIIVNRCPALVAETEVYSYEDEEDEPAGDKPIGGNDHACDALRYLIAGIDIRKPA